MPQHTTQAKKKKENVSNVSMDGGAREKLLAAALSLFNTKGYAATSVREIVEAAGVSKPVLYYYFSNKEGIYLELMTSTFSRFQGIILKTTSAWGTARERIMNFATGIFDGFAENILVVRLIYSIFFGPPQGAPAFHHEEYFNRMIAVLSGMVTEGIKMGQFRDTNVDDITWMIISCMNTVMEEQLCHSPPRVNRQGLVRMLGMVLDGIATEQNV